MRRTKDITHVDITHVNSKCERTKDITHVNSTNGDAVAENLVKQLLRIVTKDEAVTLISKITQ